MLALALSAFLPILLLDRVALVPPPQCEPRQRGVATSLPLMARQLIGPSSPLRIRCCTLLRLSSMQRALFDAMG